MDINQSFANIIMDIEQKRESHAFISEIEIIESTESKTKYKIKLTSKMDSKWSIWSGTREMDLSKIITELRNEKINFILED